MRSLRFAFGEARDAFWRAFWRRQKKYLPPAANILIRDVSAHVDKDAKVPALSVNVGRKWDDLHG